MIKKFISSPSEVISYKEIKFPLEISLENFSNSDFLKRILLEIQGEPVEVSEEYSLPVLMRLLDVAHKVSPEMILRLKNGKKSSFV